MPAHTLRTHGRPPRRPPRTYHSQAHFEFFSLSVNAATSLQKRSPIGERSMLGVGPLSKGENKPAVQNILEPLGRSRRLEQGK
jgi:hypothetical protein